MHVPARNRPYPATWLFLLCCLAVMPANANPPRPIAEVDEVYPLVPNWVNARILHIGDSHLSGGYKSRLADHFKVAEAAFHQEMWVGSRSKSWVISGKAVRLMKSFQPDVVIITLGSNNIKYDHPERELSWHRALIDRLGAKICFWVGPPPLIPDMHGYNELMKKNVHPCRYFDSRVLAFPLRKDAKFHLTRPQGTLWAEQVWQFMNGH